MIFRIAIIRHTRVIACKDVRIFDKSFILNPSSSKEVVILTDLTHSLGRVFCEVRLSTEVSSSLHQFYIIRHVIVQKNEGRNDESQTRNMLEVSLGIQSSVVKG